MLGQVIYSYFVLYLNFAFTVELDFDLGRKKMNE